MFDETKFYRLDPEESTFAISAIAPLFGDHSSSLDDVSDDDKEGPVQETGESGCASTLKLPTVTSASALSPKLQPSLVTLGASPPISQLAGDDPYHIDGRVPKTLPK